MRLKILEEKEKAPRREQIYLTNRLTHTIVLDREETGSWSAFVQGLPVYAAAASREQAILAIGRVLRAYLSGGPA